MKLAFQYALISGGLLNYVTYISGIFRFNFWWYGRWTEVIIDDYLPTDGTNLIYCSNWEEKDEFWGALLEKAYAKLVSY